MFDSDLLFLKDYLDKDRQVHEGKTANYEKIIRYLIAAEDHRYYYHPGVDIIAICRAIYKNLFFHKHEGASTIEQQLVRVLTNEYERNLKRKLKEIYLALHLKKYADKETIAIAYLDVAYYGADYQNLKKILKKFDTSLDRDMSDDVCAEVVARLKYPEPSQMIEKRREQIIKRKEYIMHRYAKIFG